MNVDTLDNSYVRKMRSQFLCGPEQVIFGGFFRAAHDLTDHLEAQSLVMPQFKYKSFLFRKGFERKTSLELATSTLARLRSTN